MLWNKQKLHTVVLPAGDAIASCQTEFKEFQELVTLFEATAGAILEATSRLEAAPGKLAERLASSALSRGQHAKVVQRFVGQISDFTMALKEAESQIGELQRLVQESQDVSAQAQQLTQLHEEAWSKKVKSDNEVEELTRDKRRAFALVDKKARLAAQTANSEAWQNSKDRSKQDVAVSIDAQRALSAAMTSKLHGVYSSIFQQSVVFKVGRLVRGWSCSAAAGTPIKDSGELVLQPSDKAKRGGS